MPDVNKLAALAEANYRTTPCCANCTAFVPGRGRFGTCARITYVHLKHSSWSDLPRPASVHETGVCERYSADDREVTIADVTRRLGK